MHACTCARGQRDGWVRTARLGQEGDLRLQLDLFQGHDVPRVRQRVLLLPSSQNGAKVHVRERHIPAQCKGVGTAAHIFGVGGLAKVGRVVVDDRHLSERLDLLVLLFDRLRQLRETKAHRGALGDRTGRGPRRPVAVEQGSRTLATRACSAPSLLERSTLDISSTVMSAVCKPGGPNKARRQSFPATPCSGASLDGTDRALAEQLGLELLGRGKDGAGLGHKLVRLDVAVDAACRRDDRRHRRLCVRLPDRTSPCQTAHAHPSLGLGLGPGSGPLSRCSWPAPVRQSR